MMDYSNHLGLLIGFFASLLAYFVGFRNGAMSPYRAGGVVPPSSPPLKAFPAPESPSESFQEGPTAEGYAFKLAEWLVSPAEMMRRRAEAEEEAELLHAEGYPLPKYFQDPPALVTGDGHVLHFEHDDASLLVAIQIFKAATHYEDQDPVFIVKPKYPAEMGLFVVGSLVAIDVDEVED